MGIIVFGDIKTFYSKKMVRRATQGNILWFPHFLSTIILQLSLAQFYYRMLHLSPSVVISEIAINLQPAFSTAVLVNRVPKICNEFLIQV